MGAAANAGAIREIAAETGWHAHLDGQLYSLTSGMMVVETRQGALVMPQGRMGWIPASHEHRARTYGALRTDRRLAVIALALLQEPDSPRQLEHWARWSGISSRTLVCGFKLEPGLSFGRWRSLARLLCSIEPLSAGVPVSEVGPRVGYENPSSFIAIFKSFFGVTPAVYVKRVAKQQTYIAECTAVSAGMRRIAEDTRTVRILRCDSPSTTRSPRHRRGREMERPRPRN